MKAKEIMSRNVIFVKKDYTVRKLIRILKENRITGAPVVDDRGNLEGIVSRASIIDAVDEMLKVKLSPGEINKLKGRFNWVEGIMTREVITVEAEDDALEVFKLMDSRNIHRIPVMEDGKIAGIISVSDAIRAFTKITGAQNDSG